MHEQTMDACSHSNASSWRMYAAFRIRAQRGSHSTAELAENARFIGFGRRELNSRRVSDFHFGHRPGWLCGTELEKMPVPLKAPQTRQWRIEWKLDNLFPYLKVFESITSIATFCCFIVADSSEGWTARIYRSNYIRFPIKCYLGLY